jgi:hypothetical protein
MRTTSPLRMKAAQSPPAMRCPATHTKLATLARPPPPLLTSSIRCEPPGTSTPASSGNSAARISARLWSAVHRAAEAATAAKNAPTMPAHSGTPSFPSDTSSAPRTPSHIHRVTAAKLPGSRQRATLVVNGMSTNLAERCKSRTSRHEPARADTSFGEPAVLAPAARERVCGGLLDETAMTHVDVRARAAGRWSAWPRCRPYSSSPAA